jgi:hypothetical protein
VAIVAYNTGCKHDKKLFDALCDLAIAQKWGRGLCTVCDVMKNTYPYKLGVRYEDHEFETIENFIEFLKNNENF